MNNFSKKAISVLLSVIMLATSFIGIGNVFAEDTADLAGKTLLFAGDSISAGYKDEANADASLKAWAKRLADNYLMEVTLAAQSGSPLSTIREPDRPAIVNQLHANKGGSFDYVILQGGVNDAMGTATDNSKEAAAPVGEMSSSFVNYAFDTSTFAGALENLFYYAKSYFPEAKVGYIITFATPLSTHGGYTADTDSMRLYWNMAKAICEKWGVSYLDFFDGTTEDGQSYSYDILKVDTATNFYGGGYDYIHLNSAGYDLTAPYVAKWLPTTTPIEYDNSNETFSEGSGTEADPFVITNETELALAITNGGEGERFFGCHFSIANDIYLNDIDAVDWSTGTANSGYTLKPWYSQDETFAGTINGNGHTVYGLYSYAGGTIKYTNNTIGSGLIPATDSAGTATIKNLGIDHSFIRQRFCAGAFVGVCGKEVIIDNCFVGSNTKVIGCHAGAMVGNGYQKTVTITNSYSLAEFETQTANDYSYGLIGYANQAKATVDNCYIVNGPITSTGGTNYNSVFKFSNSYQTVDCGRGGSRSVLTNVYTLTSDNMQGEDAFTNEAKMPYLNSEIYLATEDYPTLKVFEKEEERPQIWNGTTETPTANKEGVYIIDTAEKLAYIIENSGKMIVGSTTTQQQVVDENGDPVLDEEGNPTYEDVTTYEYDTDCTFKLTKDIYLNDIAGHDWLSGAVAGSGIRGWYEKKSFNGTIDGDFHTIYGLYYRYQWSLYHSNNGGAGLIPELKNGDKATIKNLTIDYAMVRGGTNAGTFIGGANESTAVIDSCVAGENVYVEAFRSAAFVGGAKLPNITLTNSASFATTVYAEGSNYASTGLVSEYYLNKVVVKNCFNANGPIVTGASGYLTVTNSFETIAGGETEGVTVLTKEQMQGKNVLEEGGSMAALNATANYWTATDSYPVLTASLGIIVADKYWDGTTQAPLDANGDGVYEINSPKELAYVIYNGGTMKVNNVAVEGCSFILTRDIYLNDLSLYDWASFTRLPKGQTTLNEWYTTDTDGAAFSGTIDGNNHSVYGLYSCYDWNGTWAGWDMGRGLIPSVANEKTATVKNLNLDCVYVQNESCGAGAMVGVNYGTAIFENCSVGEKVYIKGSYAGAFVGANNGAEGIKLSNCYSLATLNGYNDAGTTDGLSGLTTNNWLSSGGQIVINNSYNAKGAISSEGANITNSYATEAGAASTGVTVVTAEQMQGEKALENMPNLNSLGAYTLTTALKYPALISFVAKDEIYVPETEDEDEKEFTTYWDGTLVAPAAYDDNGNIIISTAYELAYVVKNGGGESYVLSNDIYLNDISAINWYTGEAAKGYTPAKWYTTDTSAAFTGTIDGNGYTIYGLYYGSGNPAPAGSENYKRDAVALIPSIKDDGIATIKNLGIDCAYIKGSQCAAAFVGNSNGATLKTVDSCFAGEKVTVIGHVAGGIFGGGDAELLVNNCYSLATLNGTYSSGGILGYVYSEEGDTATRKVNNSYSFNFRPFSIADGIVSENVYTNMGNTCDWYTVLTDNNMTGADALTYMGGFDGAIWYAANNGQTTPLLRVYGTAIGDVDEDGVGKRAGDILALRTAIIGAQSYLNTDYNGNGETDICDLVKLDSDCSEDKEYSVIKNNIELTLDINTYRDASGNVGDTISISGPTGPWNYASFNVSNNETYGVKFYAYPNAESWAHIFLCNSENVILETISADYAGRNYVTFTVTNKDIAKVYVRSRTNNGEKEKIKVSQIIEGIESVNMDTLGQLKFEIAPPKNYTAWPMIEEVDGKLVCLYTEADQHSFTECKLYMKTSSTNGLTWSEAKEIITEDSGARGITGTGNDSEGNMLIWYMNRNKDWSTKHTLYKTDGNTVTKVCAPDFSFTGGGHIGNIFSVPGEGLFAFYNTYGNTRSWGIVKSTDDGLTWEQIPVEQNIDSAECPVEIDGFYHDGKILALGRKDKNSGTIAMFQIQSSDNGATWTKEYTNITEDALGNSPSIIFDSQTEDIYMYYFDRNSGKLKYRTATFTGVWDSPSGWSNATVIASEPYSGQDTGNVKTVAINGMHFATYYAGSSTATGVYGVLIKP